MVIPDVGGKDNKDDNGLFIPPFNVPNYASVDNIPVYARSMVYFCDPDMTGRFGRPSDILVVNSLKVPVILMMELITMVMV